MQHKITAISPQKRNPNRVNISLDGEFAFGLAKIVAAWLQIGQELSEEKIARLKQEDAAEAAYQHALSFLSYRVRTEDEIRRHLEEKGATPQLVDGALERLRQARLVDDARFAESWVENRSEFRPRGKRALAYEMKQKGLDADTIEKSLEVIDESELAYRAGSKKIRSLQELERKEFQTRLYRYLAQRGFTYETIAEVSSRLWTESHSEEAEEKPDD
jgi:regulatory protein